MSTYVGRLTNHINALCIGTDTYIPQCGAHYMHTAHIVSSNIRTRIVGRTDRYIVTYVQMCIRTYVQADIVTYVHTWLITYILTFAHIRNIAITFIQSCIPEYVHMYYLHTYVRT
jgi:hypothetical protein